MTLMRGARGPEVMELQRKLNASASGAQLTVDGDYGPATEAAVKRYQSIHGIPATGIADDRTQQALGMSKGVASSNTIPVISKIKKMTLTPTMAVGIVGSIALLAILYRRMKA